MILLVAEREDVLGNAPSLGQETPSDCGELEPGNELKGWEGASRTARISI
jgi:hypothetical protein